MKEIRQMLLKKEKSPVVPELWELQIALLLSLVMQWILLGFTPPYTFCCGPLSGSIWVRKTFGLTSVSHSRDSWSKGQLQTSLWEPLIPTHF